MTYFQTESRNKVKLLGMRTAPEDLTVTGRKKGRREYMEVVLGYPSASLPARGESVSNKPLVPGVFEHLKGQSKRTSSSLQNRFINC